MVFSTLTFLYLFLPAALLLYYLSPGIRLKNSVLILLSLVFYAWGEPVYLLLLLFSSVVNYVLGLLIAKYRQTNRTAARLFVALAVCVGVGLLILYKYSGLLVTGFNTLFGTDFTVPRMILPIGISFYTFQTLSYTLDVYFGKAQKQSSYPDFLLFVSLFPQLLAGPIIRYTTLSDQLRGRTHSFEKFCHGILRFCVGLCKKVILANHASEIVTLTLGSSDGSLLGTWYGVLLYSLQIYFDFSGYSDMAIGVAKMFGFEYPENFNYPYISLSVTEFWRRWHISLGSWFRDYVYIPLGGKYRHQIFNIFVVWSLTGFWHGASWNFLFWGLFFGVLLTLEKLFLLKLLERLPRVLSWLYAMFCVAVGWVLFYFTDISDGLSTLGVLFGSSSVLCTESALVSFRTNLLFLAVSLFAATPAAAVLLKKLFAKTEEKLPFLQPVCACAFVLFSLYFCTGLLASSSYSPFLYFRF